MQFYDGIIEEERARAQALVDAGTPKSDVYAAIIENGSVNHSSDT